MLTKDADFTGGPEIVDLKAFRDFIIGASVATLRKNTKALEHVNRRAEGEYDDAVNALYAAIDRIKRVEDA